MMFVELTQQRTDDDDGELLWLNLETVSAMLQERRPLHTVIRTTGGSQYRVKESPSQILALGAAAATRTDPELGV